MITIYHPVDDVEVAFITSLLESEAIPFHVLGHYFGSLFPGVQIFWYNERSIQVPEAFVTDAITIIDDFRPTYQPTAHNLSLTSKLRIVIETFYFGWFVPGGKKRPISK